MTEASIGAVKTSAGRLAGYWFCTGLVAFCFLSGGIVDVLHVPGAMKGMTDLGYPLYFSTILGTWKILGTFAILAPGFRLLKEWAYAGMCFDLTGATASYLFTGGVIGHVLTPLVIAGFLAGSWALRPEGRRMARATVRGILE